MKNTEKMTITNRGRFPKSVLVLIVVFALFPFFIKDGYVMHIAVIIALTSALATCFNLSAGYAGQINFAHAAFYGIGGYTVGILTTRCGADMWTCIPIAFIGATLVGFLMGLPTLKLRGTYRVICTLGFQAIFDTVVLRWMELTNGPIGITGIPKVSIFGLTLDTPNKFFLLAFVWLLLNILLIWRIEASRFGFELLSIKGDEMAAVACGVHSSRRKLAAFSVSAGLAAVTGCLYAPYIGSIAPSAFSMSYSTVILCMSLLGGSSTILGGVIGAAILGLLPEITRSIEDYRMIVYSVIMILLVLFMPEGIAGLPSKIAVAIRQRKRGKDECIDT